jgi:hypothetical protein
MPINEASDPATSITRRNSFRAELCEESCSHAANTFYASDYLLLFLLLLLPFREYVIRETLTLPQFLNLRQSVRLLGPGFKPVARQLPNTNIHALSGIRTHDPSVLVGEDISCFRPRGHCDRPSD